MKKNLLWTLAAAFALASCSDTELMEMPPQAQEQNAIAFSTYLGDNAQSRATIVTTDTIARDGFGVNAWYTGRKTFVEATAEGYTGTKEAFMTNTKVTRNENNVWTYSPLKYWPNNAGHMVSFFAYGPYKLPTSSSFNDDKTAINFTVESEAKDQVDLIYNSNYSTIDMPKPAVNTHVKFDFKHALARIAFSVEAAVDVVESNKDNSANIDANTVINVKRVALVAADATDGKYEYTESATGPFYTGGTLSLLEPAKDDNDKYESPWSNQTSAQSFLLDADNFYRTVEYDGEEVVQLHKFNRKQQLTNDASYLMIIPQDLRTATDGGSSDGFKIYIEYDVITEGKNGDSSTITNHIVSKDAMSVNFEQGMAYKFNLVLGMTSVKFDASVASWDDATDYDNEEWLPENTEKPDFEIEYSENGKHVFLIETPADLAKMRDNVNSGKTYTLDGVSRSGEVLYYAEASYRQTASFSLAEYENWVPIGRGLRDDEDSSLDNALYAFKGIYDGNNHKISGLTVNANNSKSYGGIGLFGMVDWWDSGYPVVKNLTVEGNVTNTANFGNTGGITGFLGEGTIENCSFTGTVSGPNAGGIAGKLYDYNHKGGIINCYNGGAISSNSVLGGIAGYCSGGKIQACYNYGTLSYEGGNGTYNGAGGILGIAYSDPTEIVGCYNSGSITTNSDDVSGSILGKFYLYDSGEPISDATAKVSYCYYSSDATLAAIGSGANKTTITHVGATSDWSEVKDYMNYGLNENSIAYHYEASENAAFPLKLDSGSVAGTKPEEDEGGSDEPEEDQTPEGEGDGNGE